MKNRCKIQTQGRRQHRASRLRAIEKKRIYDEWTRTCNTPFNNADKPSDFKTYKGILFKHDSDDERRKAKKSYPKCLMFQIMTKYLKIH